MTCFKSQEALCFVFIIFIFVDVSMLPRHCTAETAPASSNRSPTVPPSCNSDGPESTILREAFARQEACIAQVVSEEESAKSDQSSETPSADDVWSAAYNQWVNKAKASKRALEEVSKRYGKATDGDSNNGSADDGFVLDDDEAVKITSYAQLLVKSDVSVEHRLEALEEVDVLCASGDNGRHLAAVGGVRTLISLCAHPVVAVAIRAIRALASCAQNNPDVYNVAVAESAVERLLDTALESGEEVGLRAASLRALVAVADGEEAGSRLWSRRIDVGGIVGKAVEGEGLGTDERRCLLRALALAERCLNDSREWVEQFRTYGLVEAAEVVLKSTDVDIREGAARVLKALR